ncbi:MAG: hypothetical protein U0231_17780 [Nitrospiraceae bacterium]
MLHRLALRVLPSLSLAVTEDAIRKKKRIVMFVPGLVAFGIYRGAKHGFDLADPLTLLILSGLVSLLTAGGSYLIGRRLPFTRVLTEDGGMRVTWLLGWIGFVYGVQLSLLVLALLWLVGYDYGKHPDGPAMMAIIISCTAVARDAFEIGHVRWVEAAGRPFVTFPDGRALRGMLQSAPPVLWAWVGGGGHRGAGVVDAGSILGQCASVGSRSGCGRHSGCRERLAVGVFCRAGGRQWVEG